MKAVREQIPQTILALLRPAAMATLVSALAACGGGGGSSSPAPSLPASPVAQQCSPNNPYVADASAPTTPGSLNSEKLWLLSYMNAAYLWYSEIPAVNAADPSFSADTSTGVYPSLDNYFQALKTPALTASGARKDKFSFTYPTRLWNDLASNGAVLGYGIEWVFGSMSAPNRNVRVAYVEPGSLAAQAGVQRGDKLETVNGVSADNDSSQGGIDVLNAGIFPDASNTGPFSFVFSRNGVAQPAQTFTAATVTKQPVLVTKVITQGGKNIGYMVFNDHIVPAETQLINAINQFKAANVSDLVLDIRYNGGGYLYIASELAYMIAGPTRTNGKVFEQLQYNDKRAAETAQAVETFESTACVPDANFNCTSSSALPTLNLPRVYVLTSSSTCSASESVINSLRGVDVDVQLIGGTTCGKPYGFTAKDNCGISYFPIEFKGVNAKGFGDYPDGFKTNCTVPDDLSRQLGDTSEGMLAAALTVQATGSCPTGTTTTKDALLKTQGQGAQPTMLRSPVRENRLFLGR